MNKKFSTLVAGFLLAGGLFTTASAEKFASTIDEGQYFQVQLDDRASFTANYMLLNSDGSYVYPSSIVDIDKFDATLWRVEIVKEKINGVDKVLGYKLINKVTGKALSATDGTVTYDTFDAVPGNCLWFKSAAIGYVNGSVSMGSTGGINAWWYDLVAVAPQAQTVAQVNAFYEGSFDLNICKQVLKDNGTIDTDKDPESYDAKGNVFAETLKAVGDNTNKENDTQFALYQVNSGKRIVLTDAKWGNITNSLQTAGYKFAAYNEKEMTANAAHILANEFIITKPSTVAGEPLEVVATNGTTKYELVVSGVDGVYYVTTDTDVTSGEADYTADGTTNANNTWVIFGGSNSINNDIFIGKVWEIYKNGKIASPSCAGEEFISTSQVATGYPEGQWLWNDKDEMFVNRESGKTLAYVGLRATDEEGVYTSGDDTWTITEVGTPGESEEGYLHGYSNDVLKQKAFFIGAPVEATEDTIYLSRGTNGVLKFSADKSDAVEFRLTPKALDANHQTTQIRNEYTAWKDADTKEQKIDIVSFTQYTITDAVSGEELYYDSKEQRYVLAAQAATGLQKAPEFLIKNKKEDTYNILFNVKTTVNGTDDKYHAANVYSNGQSTFCKDANKLLSAFNTSELVKAKKAYDLVQNDLFVIVDADAQQYRGDFSVSTLDTIKIFRNDDNSYVLYEKGNLLSDDKGEAIEGFLGMENFFDPQYAEKQPALLADTAIHANTYRPQYMLAVDANIVPAGKWCPIHGDDPTCPDAHKEPTNGYISGRYLVNLVDSAKACDNPTKNKFTHELYQAGEPYYRLGFVQAKHEGDSLIIASTKDTINLTNTSLDKVCTFAFKYVDANRDAFTIETLYDYTLDNDGDVATRTPGYIKYHNGIPVVTPKASEAWVFDLEVLEDQTPTANEDVEVSEVSIIAANGSVIVKGAAGKTVAISNILGKTIANAVVSSDNETIAVPAGITVVAVKGEEAVKVLVK